MHMCCSNRLPPVACSDSGSKPCIEADLEHAAHRSSLGIVVLEELGKAGFVSAIADHSSSGSSLAFWRL